MRTVKTNSSRSHSDKQIYIKFYQKSVLDYYKISFAKFIKKSHKSRLLLALKVMPTTAKVVSMAFKIPIESECRRKRELEKNNLLQVSRKDVVCPYSNNYAKLLTTDNRLFNSKYFGYE